MRVVRFSKATKKFIENVFHMIRQLIYKVIFRALWKVKEEYLAGL